MAVKDAMGNDLAKGDMVHIPIPFIPVGRIVTMDEGGLVIGTFKPGQPVNLSAGTMKVLIEVNINFNPTQNLNVFKLAKPEAMVKLESELAKPGKV
jgi:predicted DNA-binding antitoxin AbrB/MazE fold protein